MVLPLLWVLLAALALAASWATGTRAFAWVGCLMLAALAIGVVLARLGGRGLRAERRLSVDRISLGERAEVEVTVENRSMLPVIWLFAAETLPAGLPMTGVRGRLGPMVGRGHFRFHYTLEGARRGYYRIGPTVMRTGDLFGLAIRERTTEDASALTVFPRIIPISHAQLPSRRTTGEVRTRSRMLEDPVHVIGIRPYERTDGLRRVHWRATAHTGELQSKLYNVSAQMETTIVLNLRRADYPASPDAAAEAAELAIETAASVAHHVLDRRQRTGLLAVGRDQADPTGDPVARLATGRGREQLTAILSVLGRMALGPGDGLTAALGREKERFAWGSLVIVITPTVEEALPKALLDLRSNGYDVNVVLVGRGVSGAAAHAALAAMGVSATRVRSEEDIRGLGV